MNKVEKKTKETQKEENVIDIYFRVKNLLKKDPDNKELKLQLRSLEQKCLKRFKYIVDVKASRYRNFHNHDDLIQEGLLALLNAMETYNPTKGSFYWWASQYVETKIMRQAAKHNIIKYPMAALKIIKPKREKTIPEIYDASPNPEELMTLDQTKIDINSLFKKLSDNQKEVLSLYFGLDNRVHSIQQISKKKNLSQKHCEKIIQSGLQQIRFNLR